MQSRDEALLHVADHLDMPVLKVEVAGPNAGPIKMQNANLKMIADSHLVQDTLKLFQGRYG